ncbi:MAG: hypothetical protein M3Z04_25270 [Chloroflexota bacterium]|nr:hypothetical protein [Chloroflexota bacterium]
MRREGGLYFVPVAQRPALERLRTLLAALPHRDGQEPQFCALGVLDRVQARRQLAQAVHSRFLDDLAVMQTDLQRFQEATPGTVKEATMAERLSAYRRIKERAQVYADLLGMQQESIQGQIAALTAQARAVVLPEPAPPSPQLRPHNRGPGGHARSRRGL